MSRPPKGETWNAEKHYGCRVLKYPVADGIALIARQKNKKFGNLCNAITKEALQNANENYSYSAETASVILDKVSADNPKKEFTLYLTDDEHSKLLNLASVLGLSLNQLVVCFLREYLWQNEITL